MRFFCIATLLFSQTFTSAEEPVAFKLSQGSSNSLAIPKVGRAWLGLEVSKPEPTVTAHIPALPAGVGFVVKSIDAGGPAERAGIQEYDLIWRLDDQMLVNEAQLSVLLRLHRPGDDVILHSYRGGQPLEIKLKLGEAKANSASFGAKIAEDAVMSAEPAGPVRLVNSSEKSASFSTAEGQASVRREGEILKVKIDNPAGLPIFEGDFTAQEGFERIPENWRRRVGMLAHTLDQALEGNMIPRRQPRPRVIPPPQDQSPAPLPALASPQPSDVSPKP